MKVSVITTLYNYREYIGDCIESFLDQDFKDSEMIIVDDCSTDNPLEVIDPYLSERVRYFCCWKKGNYSIAKNVGIKYSRSDVLVMLDADDMLTKNSISTRYTKLQEGCDFVHGPCQVLKNGKLSRAPVWEEYKKRPIARNVHAQTVMLRKDVHAKIGLYDEELWSASDFEMWSRIFNHDFEIGCVHEDVAIYRMHNKQMHKSDRKLAEMGTIQKSIEEKIEQRRLNLTGLRFLPSCDGVSCLI